MKILSAEFIKSAFAPSQFIDDNFPQIAFAGRSNCGKSTLINTLLNRKKLVKTSSKPGFTKSVNYFLINNQFYFVDLPGFGFAKIDKNTRTTWDNLITTFFQRSKNLKGVIHLVDIRRLFTDIDISFTDFLNQIEKPFLVAFTKADKFSNNEITNSIKKFKRSYPIVEPIIVSSLKKNGIEELWQEIDYIVGSPPTLEKL